MRARDWLVHYSAGNTLGLYWFLFRRREKTKYRILQNLLTLVLNRIAHRHGGYIGKETIIHGKLILPHGLHGIYISRFAEIGEGCRIYQNVTIGEIERSAPKIGHGCLIGAGAIIIGGITIGDHVKIGAGAVVNTDIPENCTVVAQHPRIIIKHENV